VILFIFIVLFPRYCILSFSPVSFTLTPQRHERLLLIDVAGRILLLDRSDFLRQNRFLVNAPTELGILVAYRTFLTISSFQTGSFFVCVPEWNFSQNSCPTFDFATTYSNSSAKNSFLRLFLDLPPHADVIIAKLTKAPPDRRRFGEDVAA
jgi:hypothetical protein